MLLQAGDVDLPQRLCVDALMRAKVWLRNGPTPTSYGPLHRSMQNEMLCCTARISLQRMTSALGGFWVNSSPFRTQSLPINVSMSRPPHLLAVSTNGRMQISTSKLKPAIFSY